MAMVAGDERTDLMPPVRNLQLGYADGGDPDRFVLSTFSPNCTGDLAVAHGSTGASTAWPAANEAGFYPFVVTGPDASVIGRAYSGAIWMNGATATGNLDIGVFDALGNWLASTGSTAQSGTTAPQKASFTATVVLKPGRYFLAVVSSSASTTFVSSAPTALGLRVAGVRKLSSAFPLASATVAGSWVGTTRAVLPWVGLIDAVVGSWL